LFFTNCICYVLRSIFVCYFIFFSISTCFDDTTYISFADTFMMVFYGIAFFIYFICRYSDCSLQIRYISSTIFIDMTYKTIVIIR